MRDDPPDGTQPPVAGIGAIEPGSSQLPFAVNPEPSHDSICPFFQTIDVNGAPGVPIEAPDAANRCTALREPVPQSLRQQELVCLTSGHFNCPRYLRGSLVTGHPVKAEKTGQATKPDKTGQAAKPDKTSHVIKPDKTSHVIKPDKTSHVIKPAKVTPAGRTFTPALAGSLIVLTLAFLVSLGFVVTNGGLVLTPAAPTPSGTSGVLAEVESAAPSASPTPLPTPSPTPMPTATPTSTPSPTPIATASPTPSPKATPTPTPRPTSDRYALLKPCPDAPNCYLYVIRSGDNLYSIARYFGVPQSTIEARNPWTQNGLTVGRSLRLPPPTK